MRKALDGLYVYSGVAAALFLVAIVLVVLAQVMANVWAAISGWFGEPVIWVIPSYAEFAGYFLAASSFLGLAYTLVNGDHIRVALVIGRFPQGLRRATEVVVCALAATLSGYFAFYAGNLAWESWAFNDVSSGMIPVPLWIPQSAMVLGSVILTIALLDTLVRVLRASLPAYLVHGGGGE